MIAFACPSCGKAFTVPDDRAGCRVRCRGCDTALVVPAPAVAAVAVAVEAIEPLEVEFAPPPRPRRPPPEESPRRKRQSRSRLGRWAIDRDAAVALAIGVALAAVALAVGPIHWMLYLLMAVIHELGHTAMAWLFGQPAIPSFSLSYGNAFTIPMAQQPTLVALGFAGFGWALWRSRGDRPALIRWGVLAALWGVAVLTRLHDLLIWSAGHGSELVFAGIFLYRALSGNHLLSREEQPLYAGLACFILGYDLRFAGSLITSDEARAAYFDSITGLRNDLDLIAEALRWSLPGVARVLVLATVLTPVASLVAHRYGPR